MNALLLPCTHILSCLNCIWRFVFLKACWLRIPPNVIFFTKRLSHRASSLITSSPVLVLNVGLLPTLQKFRSAITQYASRFSPRGFISEDPHIVACAFASVPTIVRIWSFFKLCRKTPETSRKIC